MATAIRSTFWDPGIGLFRAATRNEWTSHSFRFVADTSTATLTFTDDLQSGGASSDLFLDAVSLTPLPPLGFRLEAFDGGRMLRFTWNDEPGKAYDVLRSSDLGSAPGTWTPLACDLTGSPCEVPRPPEPAAFFVLIERDQPQARPNPSSTTLIGFHITGRTSRTATRTRPAIEPTAKP